MICIIRLSLTLLPVPLPTGGWHSAAWRMVQSMISIRAVSCLSVRAAQDMIHYRHSHSEIGSAQCHDGKTHSRDKYIVLTQTDNEVHIKIQVSKDTYKTSIVGMIPSEIIPHFFCQFIFVRSYGQDLTSISVVPIAS